MEQKTKTILGEISLKAVVVSLLFIAAIFIFAFLADEVVLEHEDLFDSTVFNFFKPYTTPAMVTVMQFLTFFGTTYFFFPAYFLLIGYFLYRHKTNYAIDIAIVGISSTLLMYVLKKIFHRQRPDYPLIKTLNTYSFPSGHALCSFIFCSILIYLVWNGRASKGTKWIVSVLLFFFSIGIGISRIVLRYHYASDVLAGFCLGFAWVLFSLWLQKWITRKRKVREQEVLHLT